MTIFSYRLNKYFFVPCWLLAVAYWLFAGAWSLLLVACAGLVFSFQFLSCNLDRGRLLADEGSAVCTAPLASRASRIFVGRGFRRDIYARA
jgi:hypothetical protein